MSRSSVLTCPRSAAERSHLQWVSLDRGGWLAQLFVFASLIAWFAYTRLYFFLHPRGLTFSLSPFMYITGKPDPACGLTRTFARIWRGDLGQAVLVYPLGPLVFVLSIGLTAYLALALVTRRRLMIVTPRRIWIGFTAVAIVAVAANWTAKLIWLGM